LAEIKYGTQEEGSSTKEMQTERKKTRERNVSVP
jgi:hypothetical protein